VIIEFRVKYINKTIDITFLFRHRTICFRYLISSVGFTYNVLYSAVLKERLSSKHL